MSRFYLAALILGLHLVTSAANFGLVEDVYENFSGRGHEYVNEEVYDEDVDDVTVSMAGPLDYVRVGSDLTVQCSFTSSLTSSEGIQDRPFVMQWFKSPARTPAAESFIYLYKAGDYDGEVDSQGRYTRNATHLVVRNVGVQDLGWYSCQVGVLDTEAMYVGDSWTQFKTLAPHITGVFPAYGPVAGGTLVTLTGHSLRPGGRPLLYANMSSQQNSTEVMQHTDSEIVLLTPAVSTSLAGTTATIAVGLESGPWGDGLVLQAEFKYKENPEVNSFYPNETILAGGINLTVQGEHLESVALHRLTITMRHTLDNHTVTETDFCANCTVLNTTCMVCPTPDLTLPDAFINVTIDLSESTVETDEDGDKTHISKQHLVSNQKLQFYVRIKSDGVTTFEQQGEEKEIVVFRNPTLEPFSPLIQHYSSDMRLTIKGKYLRVGVREEEYRITVGGGRCLQMDVFDQQVSCDPPSSEPEMTSEQLTSQYHRKMDAPMVMVRVGTGKLNVHVGYLKYPETDVTGVIVGCCVGGTLVAAIAAIFFCIRRCKHTGKGNPWNAGAETKGAETKGRQPTDEPRPPTPPDRPVLRDSSSQQVAAAGGDRGRESRQPLVENTDRPASMSPPPPTSPKNTAHFILDNDKDTPQTWMPPACMSPTLISLHDIPPVKVESHRDTTKTKVLMPWEQKEQNRMWREQLGQNQL